MNRRFDGPIVGDPMTGELEITGNPSRDFTRAIEHDHPCDDIEGCDIARALDDGFPIWAANLLLGATEAPLVDAVLSWYSSGTYAREVLRFDFDREAKRECDEWLATDTWSEHAFECHGCSSISFGDDTYEVEQCPNCLSTDVTRLER